MDAAGAGRDPAFPMQQIPMLLFPPPPPPPPLAAYSSSSSSTTPHHPSITSFPILVLTVLGILTASVLLLTYYVFVIRCCLNWHSSSDVPGLISRRRGASSGLPVATVRGAPAEARGLEESSIQALPAFRYRKAINNTVDSSECTVCLSEFQEEERVRLLPSCLHVFHVDCIDTWLQGNANCPLCRAAITTATSSSCHRQLPLMDQLPRPEEVVIQVVTGTEEEEGTQTQQQQEAAESAGDTTTDQQVSSKKRKNIKKPWHDVTSKGDECIEVKRDRDVLPMRRSFSMDSLDGGEVHLQVQKIFAEQHSFPWG